MHYMTLTASLFFFILMTNNIHAKDIWIGTAPFCSASASDCTKRGMQYIRSDKRGDGNKCATGKKVLCRQIRKPELWIGTAPFCAGKPSDCTNRGMKYVKSSVYGDGKKCHSGRKVLCRPYRPGEKPAPPDPNTVWIGTAPVCAGKPTDCTNRGMRYVRSSVYGNGKKCLSGRKVLCKKDPTILPIKWIGTAPVCKGRRSDCESRDMDYVRKSRTGNGKRCIKGFKVMCRGRRIRQYNRNGINTNLLYVLSANIYSRPFIISHDGQTERLAHIPRRFAALANAKIDVIVFQETFITNKRFLLELKQAGFFLSKRLNPGLNKKRISNGGVLIASRWPIVDQGRHVYNSCTSLTSDCLAAKGVIYVKILKSAGGKSRYYHVFGTHMQASGGNKNKSTRHKQAVELVRFMNRMRIPRNQPVIIAGDLNEGLSSNRKLLNILNANLPRFTDRNRASSNPRTNQLAGSGRPEFLDYVLIAKRYLKPVSSSIKILPLKANRQFAACLSAPAQPHHVEPFSPFCKRTKFIRDYSDHYPVMGVFRY